MADLDLKTALAVAREAAETAGAILKNGFGKPHQITRKSAIDLVTEYDLKSEEAIARIILAAFPDHALMGEENGLKGRADSPWQWYIDPLDGTTNFAHGHPFFCCSIALTGPASIYPEPGKPAGPVLGVVNAPILNQCFWGLQGQGAYLGDLKLRTTRADNLENALLGTGFPYDFRRRPGPVMATFERLAVNCQGIRRAGAAALDLAYVAWGALDGFWEAGLKPWDTAAGLLLVLEAGGLISDFWGRPYLLGVSPDIAAAGPALHPQLCALVTNT